MRRILLTSVLLLTAIAPAAAQDLNTILDIPKGSTLINLSATERVEVDQDLLISQLSFEAENDDAAKLQDTINKVMTKALSEAKAVNSVKVSTQSYQVYPYDFNPDPRPLQPGEQPKLQRKWRGSQSLILKGKIPDDLLKLAGKMQALGMNMTSLSYTVSPELLEETQNSLLESALVKLKTKAERTAKALNKSKSNLLNVNVDVGGYYPQPIMHSGAMMMKSGMAESDAAAPVAASGQSDITLTVNAQAMIE
jgi:predicted secreted protein